MENFTLLNLTGTFIFSAGIIQGIILVFVLLHRRARAYPNIVLSVFILVLTLQVVIKLQELYFGSKYFGNFYSVLYYLPYLYGPLVYLYIKKTFSGKSQFKLSELFHLLPFLLTTGIMLLISFSVFNIFRYINNDLYNIGDTFVQLAVLGVYITAAKKIVNKSNEQKESNKNWFAKFSNAVWISGSSLIILFTLIFYKVEILNIQFNHAGFMLVILPFMIYWISYNALIKPELFITGNTIAGTTGRNVYVRYNNNRLGENEITSITCNVENFMKAQKPYLSPELSLDTLAKSVNISKHHVSQALNLKLGINFNDYINSKRVENAKSELLNPKKQHLTIAAIAMDSGFNSISAFNEAFKKFTSLTPTAFRKQHIAKKSG